MSQASSRVLRGNLGLLLCCRKKGPHLTLMGESFSLSRVTAGGLGFDSRYHEEFREPLVFRQGSQVSTRVERLNTGVLWSRGRGIRSQFAWKGESQGVSRVAIGSVGSLKLPRGPEGASHVVSGKSGILSSCEGPLGIPLKLVQATRASCRVEAGNSGFLSSSDRDLRVYMEVPLGSQTSSYVGAWNCTSLSRWQRGVRPPVKLR